MVIVIAILAAIVIVAYNGITNRTKEASLKTDLEAGAKQLQIAKIDDGIYPPSANNLKKIHQYDIYLFGNKWRILLTSI